MEPSSKLLDPSTLTHLKEGKNLLAFSAGVDSTALFFLLLEADITFDIAIVDYAKREQSKEEVAYAQTLSKKYGKTCHVTKVSLEDANFEAEARKARYVFFESLIQTHAYTNLITAHQLNDRFEWLLMQLTKGAGTVELLGFSAVEERSQYMLVRPLINADKACLLNYLHANQYTYFEDVTNQDESYRRNYFRHKFSEPLIQKYAEGIKKSFAYLQADVDRLFDPKLLLHVKQLYIFQKSENDIENIRIIDKTIKLLGYILSASQREDIIKQQSIVIADRIAIEITEDRIYISPYIRKVMDKKFKEACRIKQIPSKIRGYLYQEDITPALTL